MGIIGCGRVGKEVALLCRAFGAPVIAHDIVSYSEFYRQNGVTPVSLAQLLAEADTSPCTRRSIDRREDSSANVNSPR